MVGNEIKAVGNIIHAVIEKDTRSIPYPIPDLVTNIVAKVFKPFTEEMDLGVSKHKPEQTLP